MADPVAYDIVYHVMVLTIAVAVVAGVSLFYPRSVKDDASHDWE